jgi:hypothetical protein
MEIIKFLPGFPPPQELEKLERLMQLRDSFVALIDGNLYETVNYHDPRHQFEFSACLDRNVYSRITSLVGREPLPPEQLPEYRWAAAILAFCQLADITFDYSSSLYELADSAGGDAAIKALKYLTIADNSDPELFVEFALGKTDCINFDLLTKAQEEKNPSASEFEKPLSDFRINYIFALKIAELASADLSPVEKMLRFIEWMHFDYYYGAPALLFANRYFSPTRYRRMLKGHSRRNVRNAAWDMTFVQDWRRRALKGRDENKPVILVSGDKAVRAIAKRIVANSEEEMIGDMKEIWGKSTPDGKKIWRRYSELEGNVQRGDPRRTRPNPTAEIEILDDLEKRLFADKPAI